MANFHEQTVKSLAELLTAAGLDHPEDLTRSHICRRTSSTEIKHLDEIHPNLEPGCMLNGGVPEIYQRDFNVPTADSFLPIAELICCEPLPGSRTLLSPLRRVAERRRTRNLQSM